MANVKVEFIKTHSSGLLSSHIYVNGDLLSFANDKTTKMLPVGEEFEIYWRIAGNPNSSLTVKYKADGVTKTAVDKSKIASNRSRKSDFRFIEL